jgi:hypothetical protein
MRAVSLSQLVPGDALVINKVIMLVLTRAFCDAGSWLVWFLRPDQSVGQYFWSNPTKTFYALNDAPSGAVTREVC